MTVDIALCAACGEELWGGRVATGGKMYHPKCLLDDPARLRDENKRLLALLELAYDGLLNHHLHDIQERDDYTNRVGAGLTDEQRRRVMFGDEQSQKPGE